MLLETLRLHQQLYNAALEQRIAAYRLQGKALTAYDQMRDLTALRADDPAYRGLGSDAAATTLKRVDRAFKAFFRRVKSGDVPGFPRFRSLERFSGWGYKVHGAGFRLTPGADGHHGRLRLKGIGIIRVRGRARTQGVIRTGEIQRKGERWYLVLSVLCESKRERGAAAIGLDWGVETFATIAREDGSFQAIENPRFTRSAKDALAEASRAIASKTRGSRNRAKAKAAISAIHRKTANRRLDFLHKASGAIIASSELVATETLSISSMTRSTKGTVENPGRNVAQKAGLNREILSTAPSAFLAMLRYKAAEAGVEYVEVPSRKVKPSQTCSACGAQRKKPLSERTHVCDCGLTLTRDQNAARVNLQWALARPGREPSGCLVGRAP